MMLRAFLPSLPQRYAFAGSAIGAILPIVGLSTEAFFGSSVSHIWARMLEPMHALLLTVPVLSGMVFHRIGRMRMDFSRRLEVRESAARQLFELSLKDRLTGLPNRRALEREIARFGDARQHGRFRPAVLLLDLDKFKTINDTLGHDAGDELLCAFADRIGSALGPLARLFRLGGDEFVITIAGAPENTDVQRLCRVIEAKADAPFELSAGRVVCGVSIGISFLEVEDDGFGDVMRRADLALYISKDMPGSMHAFHTDKLGQAMTDQAKLEQEIAAGLKNDEFFLEYQPIMNADDRSISAFEALLRWRHPLKGVLGPDAFLPTAQRTGHMPAFGRLVFSRAISDAANWPEEIGVAINVFGEEFVDIGLVRHIRQMLAQNGVDARRLTVEVKETTFLLDHGDVRTALLDLRDAGVRIALDDFGMGSTSIHDLKQFPVDHLKVDASFTRAMTESGRDKDLVDVILKLGRAFNIGATMEGVEDQRQMDLAMTLGATSLQGFLISRPISADTVQAMLIGTGPSPLGPAHFLSA